MVKKEFDAKYSGCWHVIVGKHFGSFVTHEVRRCGTVLLAHAAPRSNLRDLPDLHPVLFTFLSAKSDS